MTMYGAPICKGCKQYRGITIVTDAEWNTGSCDAYPAPSGIPLAIWHSEADHRTPFAGDHGIVFAPNDPQAARYAAKVFARNVDGKGN